MNPIIEIEYIILLSILIILSAAVVSWRSSSQTQIAWRILMTLARTLAVTGVLALLVNFGSWEEKVEEIDSSWVVMLDKSSSMGTDDIKGETRWNEARSIIEEAVEKSEHPGRINIYAFDKTIQQVSAKHLESLLPDGSDTKIVKSGMDLLAQWRTRSSALKGVLMLTDGRQPDYESPDAFALKAAARNTPIFPLVLGGNVPVRDLQLKVSRRQHVSFLGQPVTLQASIINNRMGSIQTTVNLSDVAGKPLADKTLFLTNGQSQSFTFEVTPDKSGYYEYVIATEPRENEANRSNNQTGLGVFVLEEKINVLLLEGEPYWDTKFLSHLLRGQTNMSVTAITRIAQNRFFKVSTDAPLKATGSDTYPASDDELAEYDLIVLGRGTEYMITEERAYQLERFVMDHGGCVFFARGKSYNGTESYLKRLEPLNWGKKINSEYSIKPLLAGEQAGLFGGILPEREDKIWKSLPPMERAHQCKNLKSFASVLAQGNVKKGSEPPFPAIISKRYGRGLVLMINGDGLWKWGFFPKVTDKHELYHHFWTQLFQWAISFAEFNPGSSYALQTDRNTAPIGTAIRVRLKSRSKTDIASPVIRVYQNEKAIQAIGLAADATQIEHWSGLVTLPKAGVYKLSAELQDGTLLGVQTTVQILPPPSEADNLSSETSLLERIADLSGGKVIERSDLPALIENLEKQNSSGQAGDIVWEHAWDKAWIALLLMFCFVTDWYCRRRQGLM